MFILYIYWLLLLSPSQVTIIFIARAMNDRQSYCVLVKPFEGSFSCSHTSPTHPPIASYCTIYRCMHCLKLVILFCRCGRCGFWRKEIVVILNVIKTALLERFTSYSRVCVYFINILCSFEWNEEEHKIYKSEWLHEQLSNQLNILPYNVCN